MKSIIYLTVRSMTCLIDPLMNSLISLLSFDMWIIMKPIGYNIFSDYYRFFKCIYYILFLFSSYINYSTIKYQ